MLSVIILVFIFLLICSNLYLNLRIKKLEYDLNCLNSAFKDKTLIDGVLLTHTQESSFDLKKDFKFLEKSISSLSENFSKFQKDVQAFIELVLEFISVIEKESGQKLKNSTDNFLDSKNNKKDPPKPD